MVEGRVGKGSKILVSVVVVLGKAFFLLLSDFVYGTSLSSGTMKISWSSRNVLYTTRRVN
jgi:hypothetical protein